MNVQKLDFERMHLISMNESEMVKVDGGLGPSWIDILKFVNDNWDDIKKGAIDGWNAFK